jgi:hypothetical protein
MNRTEEIKEKIAALQAELEELLGGFMPLSELAKDLQVGDLIELKVEDIYLKSLHPIKAGGGWHHGDDIARKSRSQHEPAWLKLAALLNPDGCYPWQKALKVKGAGDE